MALFGRDKKEEPSKEEQKKQQQKVAQEKKTRLAPYEIHVMPEKFRATDAVSQKSGAGKWIVIAVIVFVVVIGAAAAIYFVTRQETVTLPATQPAAQPTVTEPTVPESPTVPEIPEVPEDVEVPEIPEAPTTIPASGPVTYESTIDSDDDRLTNTEETLYQTEPRVKDTDGDGFDDGTEVINGFNPKSAGLRLADSGLVNSYQNPLFNYSVLHPASWLARATDQSLSEVIFQSTTGEFVRITTLENPTRQSLLDWYLDRMPQADPSELRQKNTSEQLTALVTPTGLEYFIADPDDVRTIYYFEYEVGTRTKLNFLTTFEMMTNNFSL